jgi:ATP-dependent Zn protease
LCVLSVPMPVRERSLPYPSCKGRVLLENQLNLHGDAKARETIRIRLLVQQFTMENRAAIETVANALIERKTLTKAEINELVKRE